MSRDDLISTNAGIVVSCVKNILKYSKNPIIIVVSTVGRDDTCCVESFGLTCQQSFGMAGCLDTARYQSVSCGGT